MGILLLCFIVFYFISIFLARFANYLLVKRNLSDERFINIWFIPIFNFCFAIVEIAEVLYKWNGRGNPSYFSRLIDKFVGKEWRPKGKEYELDPSIERILNNINMKDIEQYLRKKKLRKLK